MSKKPIKQTKIVPKVSKVVESVSEDFIEEEFIDDEEEEEDDEDDEDDEEEEEPIDEKVVKEDEEEEDEEEDEEEEDEQEEEGIDEEVEEEEEEGIVDGEDDDINIKDDEDDDIINVGCEEYDIDSIAIRVPAEERITSPMLTKYETALILGIRVQQLIKSAPAFVTDTAGKSPMHIAIDELLAGRLPFKIKRPLPYPKYEIWKLSELKVTLTQDDIDDLIECINF